LRVVATDGFFDPLWTNGMRAEAGEGVIEYCREELNWEGDDGVIVVDLISDLLHRLHASGGEPEMRLIEALEHFRNEAGCG
jgi:hypothetical protein